MNWRRWRNERRTKSFVIVGSPLPNVPRQKARGSRLTVRPAHPCRPGVRARLCAGAQRHHDRPVPCARNATSGAWKSEWQVRALRMDGTNLASGTAFSFRPPGTRSGPRRGHRGPFMYAAPVRSSRPARPGRWSPARTASSALGDDPVPARLPVRAVLRHLAARCLEDRSRPSYGCTRGSPAVAR